MRNPEALHLVETLKRDPSARSRHSLERRWSRPALRAALVSGEVTRMLPGLYAATEHAESPLTRASAATTWVGRDSVVVGASAAAVWDLCEPPRVVTATAPPGMSRALPPWLALRRIAERPPWAWWHGCPVALPAWAIATAYGQLPRDVADSMVYRAVRRDLATPDEIAEVGHLLTTLGGRRALLSTVAAAAKGSESHLETFALRRVFAAREFGSFIRQHLVRIDGTLYRLDMYDPATRTAVELDGAVAHTGDHQRARDSRRDARLASVGIATLRFTYQDITARGDWCRAMVRRTLIARGDSRLGTSATTEAGGTIEWA